MKNIQLLVKELIKCDAEAGCVEFKKDNSTPRLIGEYISALSNTATYSDRQYAYLVWGIDDITHDLIGTNFNYRTKKGEGNEDLEPWLRRLLSDNANFEFTETKIEGKTIVLLIIYKALGKTVTFSGQEFIRVGSYKKKLKDYPAIESVLWSKINGAKYEEMTAKSDVYPDEILSLLDYTTYFELRQMQIPSSTDKILFYLEEEQLIKRQDDGLYAITNLGALLFARKLSDFPSLLRKSVRLVQYKDDTRLNIVRQHTGSRGYASGFEGLITFIGGLLPSIEEIESPIRKEKTVYPIVAIRELVANALIHQDLTVTGTGPVIELFKSRIEITNPGTPIVSISRIIDNPPRSRNELMANLMRRLGVCEELGTGWDRVATYCEHFLLPAPSIEIYEENTRVTMFGPRLYKHMTQEERLWTCYLHACLKYVNYEKATNASLRERLGLEKSAAASVSRLIALAVEKEYIKPLDEKTAPRYMSYIPFWA